MLSWSFSSAAACGLSLLALLGSTGAQLNNDTSPTSQFKSVCTLPCMGTWTNVEKKFEAMGRRVVHLELRC
jgi:hypothetical protein